MEYNNKIVAGVDDAGRGPIIGPLVIAGISIREKDIRKLVEIGVKDSKKLTSRRREKLVPMILNIVLDWSYEIIPANKIDEAVFYKKRTGKGRLNELEAKAMAEVIKKLRPQVAFVDTSDVNEERYREYILKEIPFKVEIISRHKADQIFAVVSAASIIAKVKRDTIIKELQKTVGDFGSGYPSDPKTQAFIIRCIKDGKYPTFIRKSWSTIKRLKMKMGKL